MAIASGKVPLRLVGANVERSCAKDSHVPALRAEPIEARRGFAALLARIAGKGIGTIVRRDGKPFRSRSHRPGSRLRDAALAGRDADSDGQALVAMARQLRGNPNGRPQSLRRIAADLAKRGYVTPTGKTQSIGAAGIARSCVRYSRFLCSSTCAHSFDVLDAYFSSSFHPSSRRRCRRLR